MTSNCKICGNEYIQYHNSDKYCRECRPKAQMMRWNKYKENNRERIRAAQRRYRERHPDRTRLAFKKHYYSNRERVLVKHNKIRRRYYVKHADRLREKRKRFYHKNLEESRMLGRISAKKYRLNNRERYEAARKRTYEKNREKILERIRKWQMANPERARLNKRMGALRRFEKMLQVNHSFSMKEWKEKLQMTNGICNTCKNNVGIRKLTLDHIMPLSKAPVGFVYTINDVQPLCVSCNSRKHNKIEETSIQNSI